MPNPFESTSNLIKCLKCSKVLRPLGLCSVACDCRSFTIGLSDLNATFHEKDSDQGMIFGSWPVTMADIKAIHQTRCDNCDHFDEAGAVIVKTPKKKKKPAPRCNYCRKPSAESFQYRGYLARAGRAPFTPLLTVAACSDHVGCISYESEIQSKRGRIVKGGN